MRIYTDDLTNAIQTSLNRNSVFFKSLDLTILPLDLILVHQLLSNASESCCLTLLTIAFDEKKLYYIVIIIMMLCYNVFENT